jgi:hypothetical protein
VAILPTLIPSARGKGDYNYENEKTIMEFSLRRDGGKGRKRKKIVTITKRHET